MNIKDRKILYEGFYKLSELTVQDGSEEYQRIRFEPGEAVAALVLDTTRQRYPLVRQFRVGAEADVLELPAGMLDKEGESPEEALRREIKEELGYKVDHLEQIIQIYPSPGANAERITIYYAEVSEKIAPGGGEASEGEKITAEEFTWDELIAEPLQDAKTLIAVQWAQLRKAKG
jgi:ADP-ribose pyrophosphatase